LLLKNFIKKTKSTSLLTYTRKKLSFRLVNTYRIKDITSIQNKFKIIENTKESESKKISIYYLKNDVEISLTRYLLIIMRFLSRIFQVKICMAIPIF